MRLLYASAGHLASLSITYRNSTVALLISFFENTQLFFRIVLKTNYGIHSAWVRIYCVQNVIDCPFVQMNYSVEIWAQRISYWGHYGRRRTPLLVVWGSTSTAHTLSPHRGPLWRGVTLTVHSWQSVSSPPTTMRYLRCGEQGLCWLQLKPSSSSRTCRLWSFFFQRAQMLTLLYAWETRQPSLPRKKKIYKSPVCLLQIQNNSN